MTTERGIACVYLTGSIRDAVRAQRVVAAVHVRVYRAANLAEAIVVLRTVQGMVLLVDYSFPGGGWRDALRVVSQRYPEAAVVVAVAPCYACVWEQVFAAGGFEVVLKPFDLQELGPILREADSYSSEFFSSSARLAHKMAAVTEIGTGARNGCAVGMRGKCRWRSGLDARAVGGIYRASTTSLLAALRRCLHPKHLRNRPSSAS